MTDPRKVPPVFTMLLATLAFVLVPFLFWYLTWFGRILNDHDLGKYLTDTSVPHQTQHAIAQLGDMMARHDPAAQRWHPPLLALARNQESQFRLMAAWAMGQDAKSDDFHQSLLTLLRDPEPAVRWNAALALIRFGDASGEPELHLMLRPYTLPAPATGTITPRVKEKYAFDSGTVLARIKSENGDENRDENRNGQDVRAPMSGALERWIAGDGAHVVRGDAIAVLAPGADQVWEALRALVLVGQPADLEDVERFAHGVAGMNERIRMQAELTDKAIRGRMANRE